MQRRTLLQGLAALIAVPLLPACARKTAATAASNAGATTAWRSPSRLKVIPYRH